MKTKYQKWTSLLFFVFAALLLLPQYGMAQNAKSLPDSTSAKIGKATVKIKYFSPSVRDRQIWGNLVKYDEVWRTGANNATVLELSKPMIIDGKTIPAGKYALFTIPKKGSSWTVILNKTWDQWGAYNYDEAQDIHRFEVKTKKEIEIAEQLKFHLNKNGTLKFEWEYISFEFEIKEAK